MAGSKEFNRVRFPASMRVAYAFVWATASFLGHCASCTDWLACVSMQQMRLYANYLNYSLSDHALTPVIRKASPLFLRCLRYPLASLPPFDPICARDPDRARADARGSVIYCGCACSSNRGERR